MKAPRKVPTPEPAAPKVGAFTLFDLRLSTCRWPTRENPTLYCGAPRADHRAYCKAHNAMGYAGRGTPAEAKIARELAAAAARTGASA